MFKKFLNDESGQGMVEYGLIIALVAVAVIVAITALGGSIKNIFNKTASEIANAETAA